MFEDQLQAVHELLEIDDHFREMHDKHQSLRNQIETSGQLMDQFKLDRLKKEKLMLKDKMAAILAAHTR
ncbi:MAG: DUF465 domain-containing protein [Magnetococcales bacterium]|nr:DUF465 domain-containing protein [Magnetococcales bacterium]